MMLNIRQRFENFLAYLIFPLPRKFPVKAEAANEIPNGSIKINVTQLTTITSAAS